MGWDGVPTMQPAPPNAATLGGTPQPDWSQKLCNKGFILVHGDVFGFPWWLRG